MLSTIYVSNVYAKDNGADQYGLTYDDYINMSTEEINAIKEAYHNSTIYWGTGTEEKKENGIVKWFKDSVQFENKEKGNEFENSTIKDGLMELADSFTDNFDGVSNLNNWGGFLNDVRNSGYDTSNSAIFRFLRTLGVNTDDLENALGPNSYAKEEMENFDSVWNYVVKKLGVERAIDWFFKMLESWFKPGNSTEAYKPNIYFYGFEGKLEVDFEAPQYLKSTIPEYEEGWNVVAEPKGTLKDEYGNTYEYLFYECYTEEEYYQTEKGFALPAGERVETFTEILDAYGFTEEEKEDFIEFWTVKLEAGVDYIMYPQYTETIDISYPIKVTPEPDTYVRLWFAFVENKGQGYTEETIEPFERVGKTMFEWGGLIFD